MKNLDNNSSFFLESDIQEFEKYRNTLDDAMKSGELAAPYDIFNTYTERFNETIDFVLAHLTDSIDYNSNQKFTMDREDKPWFRSEEHTSDLQSLMRLSYAVFCLKKKKHNPHQVAQTYNSN